MPRNLLDRRAVLTWGIGGAGAVVLGAPSASAATPVTMWRLDPAWGTPLTTTTGATRTRCRGSVCHRAAPHRYFLTAADAVAGRLHPGCLAQPVPVVLTVDLNELMPYYRARHGGVDVRCPELPAALRASLLAGRPGSAHGATGAPVSSGGGSGSSGSAGSGSSGSDDSADAAGSVGGTGRGRAGSAGDDTPEGRELAFTGGHLAATTAVGVGVVAVGAATLAVSRRCGLDPAVVAADVAGDQGSVED